MVTIRHATETDAPAAAELASHVFTETYGAALTQSALNRYLSAELSQSALIGEINSPDQRVLLAFRNERLAGISLLTRNRAPACVPIRPAIELSRFYVDRQQRGTGLAQELLIHTRHAAWEVGAAVVWLCAWERNARALAFYRKHGFLEVGIKTIRVAPVTFYDVVLASELRA